MLNITVLGGLGYIGSHLSRMLVDSGHNVTILDIAWFGFDHINDVLEKENCEWINGDIRHSEDLSCAIKNSDVVVHLAGIVGDPACSLDNDETWLQNIESSNLIVDVCNHYDIQKFIFASSCSVYGAAPSDILLNEGSYLNPVSLYAESKIKSEKIFLSEFNNICTILRLSTVFGYSERMRFDLVANLFTIKAIKEKKIQVFGGSQYRPFIHCKDVARAIKKVIDFPDKIKIDKEVFNISVENISIRELGILVSELTDSDIELVETKEDDRNYKVSADKIKWLLGYKPYFGLASGILHMIESIKGKRFDDWVTNKQKYENVNNLQERRKTNIK